MPLSIDWIAFLACLAALSGLLFWGVRRRRDRKHALPAEWALTSRSVFSIEERRFYRQLCTALPDHIVLAKLPLVRFCQPTDNRQVRYWYELLGVVHVTFAICSGSGRVVAVIDVEGERGSSRRTLQIKEAVLAACGIRYLRCPPDAPPSATELQQLAPAPRAPRSIPAPSPVNETRNKLSRIVATRRQERASRWQDAMLSVQDSTFGDSLLDPPGASLEPDTSGSPLRH